jgi:hypothetical protein
VLGSDRGGRRGHDDEIDPEPDQLGGQLRESLRVAFREPALEDEVPPFAIPSLPQPVQERIPPVGGWGIRPQVADPVNLARRLRLGGERCHEETEREGEEEHGTQGEEEHATPGVKRAALHRALLSANPRPWKPNARGEPRPRAGAT